MKKSEKLIKLLILILTPLVAFFFMQYIYGGMPWHYSLNIIFINYFCICLLFGLLCALLNRYTLASWLTNFICIVFGSINYFVNLYRGLPVVPWDLKALNTAFNVASSYDFSFSYKMIISFIFLFILALVYYYAVEHHKLYINKIYYRIITIIICVALFIPLVTTNVLAYFGVNIDVWDQGKTYLNSGLIASFIGNSKYMKVEKPSNHSIEHVNEIMDDIKQEIISVSEVKPNIVVIMNESWADFEKYGIIETNDPLMENIKNSGASIGHAYASVFGAGTSCSEFEFLTGHTMAFLPSGSIPYQQYVTPKTHALPNHLKDLGYDTIALHPGEANSWQRNLAYPKIGFDNYKSALDFNVDLTYEHGYISDHSSFEQIIYEFEHKNDEPLFLFNVTIQNHGAYTVKDYPNEIDILNAPKDFPMAKQYLTLINKTDEDFNLLVDYFSHFEEPTIILMFGDHQPSLEKEFIDFALDVDPNDMSMEEYMRKFEVPYVLWSNYGIHELDLTETTSLNYLASLLIKQTGLTSTPYFDYLNGLKQTIPAISFVGYTDIYGNRYSHLETNEFTKMIKDFQKVQYNYLFD